MPAAKIGTAYLDPSRLPENPLMVEFGANAGRSSIEFLRRFGGRCIAYEPGQVADSIPETPGLTVKREALGMSYGRTTFYDLPESSQSSSLIQRQPKRGQCIARQIRQTTLGLALRGIDWIDFCNIDIEGGEWPVIAEAGSLLRRIDQICVEFHSEFSGRHTLDEMIGVLEREGWFECEIVERSDKRPIVWGVKRAMPMRPHANRWLRSMLAGKRFGRVLNLACGTDRDQEGACYADYIDADEIINVDMESGAGVDVVARGEELPFDDNEFDFVFCNWAIYKMRVPEALSEIVRVSRPGAVGMLSWGSDDLSLCSAIRALAPTVYNVWGEWWMDYAAGRAVRRADGIIGTLRPDAGHAFECRFEPPVLLLVAHWDDEAFSFGATMAERGAGWDIVCATHRDQHPTYRGLFDEVVRGVGGNPYTLDLRQRIRPMDPKREDRHEYARNVQRIRLDADVIGPALIEQVGDLSRYRTVITHCLDGDYNHHVQHIQLAKAVSELFPAADKWSYNNRSGTVVKRLDAAEKDAKLEMIRVYKPKHRWMRHLSNEYLMRLL